MPKKKKVIVIPDDKVLAEPKAELAKPAPRKVADPYDPQVAHELICRKLGEMSEFLDNIQILASRVSPDGGTESFEVGCGNILARVAQCVRFVNTASSAKEVE